MVKKVISIVIILSMILHCASRLGTLSYLYEKRMNIAYSVGLISEVPIANCGSDYDFNKGLVVQQDDTSQRTPISLLTAQEILLFTPVDFFHLAEVTIWQDRTAHPHRLALYTNPVYPIFHPPLV